MKLTPAKLSVAPVAVVLTALLVCRPPEPAAPPPPPEPDPEAAALAAPWPDVVPLRLVAKQLLARAVADGRRSLGEAAALFRELNRLPPARGQPPEIVTHVHIPMDTEAGWLCRQVAEHVHGALREEPERAAAVVARLEAEFFAEWGASGAIRLPDPASLEPVEELLRQARARLAEQQRGHGSRPGQP
jgi:hypothetical protein